LLLDTGLVRAFVVDAQGQEATTGFYSRGQVAVDASSFLIGCPAQQQLNALFHARPKFREFGRAVLVPTLATLQERMLNQIRETAHTHYEKLLATSPEVFHHAPLKYIASYLGVIDSSLSRIRSNT
jgi:hypothetical protein